MGALAAAVPRNQSNEIKFEVISAKVMTSEESTKIAGPDFIGADVLVRLRLSAPTCDISFYGLEYNRKPIGHRIKWSEEGKMLIYPIPGKEAKVDSPRIDDLRTRGLPGKWFHLDAEKAVEWEVLDGTRGSGERHGTNAFVRFLPNERPVEVFSDSYLVPEPSTLKSQHSQ